MRVHQVRWSKNREDFLEFNTLSFFQCTERCEHYFLKEVVHEPVVDVDERKDNSKKKNSDSNGEQKIHKEKPIDCNLGQKDSNLIEIMPSNNDSDFTVGDWVAVQFDMEERRHRSLYRKKCFRHLQCTRKLIILTFFSILLNILLKKSIVLMIRHKLKLLTALLFSQHLLQHYQNPSGKENEKTYLMHWIMPWHIE